MKRDFYLLGAGCIVATSLLFIGSCSTDVEETFSENLSIEKQIPRVKRTIEGIPVEKDECGLYALMLVKAGGKDQYWNEPGRNADEYYERMKKYAEEECGYKGGEMNASTLLDVGKKFNIIEDSNSFDANTMSCYDCFVDRKPKMVGNPGHIGRFVSFNEKTNKVRYQDSTGSHEWNVSDVTTIFY